MSGDEQRAGCEGIAWTDIVRCRKARGEARSKRDPGETCRQAEKDARGMDMYVRSSSRE
jgi:hypothetical protein